VNILLIGLGRWEAANPVPPAAGVRALAVVEAAAQAAQLGTTVSL
jgi:hypothetical protein